MCCFYDYLIYLLTSTYSYRFIRLCLYFVDVVSTVLLDTRGVCGVFGEGWSIMLALFLPDTAGGRGVFDEMLSVLRKWSVLP